MADTQRLREHLLALAEPLFAVVDGAQFNDLPEELFDGDFVHRPLYLDRGDGHPDRLRTAPQLVWLDEKRGAASVQRAEVLESLLTLVGERPAAVFWACPLGGEALYRHLRTINMVLIPRETGTVSSDEGTDDIASGDAQGDDSPAGYERVLFRHANADVMAQVLPALDEGQFARLFGPASAVLCVPDEEWSPSTSGVMLAPRPEALPPVPKGPLRIDAEAMEAIAGKRLAQSRQKVSLYLRSVAPEYVQGMSDLDLNRKVIEYEKSGNEVNLKSERAHAQWAFLNLVTGDEFQRGEPVKKAFSDTSPDEADDVMFAIMKEMARIKE
jgi:hypothetical protein